MFVPKIKQLKIALTLGLLFIFSLSLFFYFHIRNINRDIHFSLPDIFSSEVVNSNEWVGKFVYIDVWATWCKPCIEILPQIQKLSEAYANKPILFVGVNQDSNTNTAIDFLNQHSIRFKQLYDPFGEVLVQLNLKGLPASILLDQSGRIIYRHEGGSVDSISSLRVEIDRMLASQ